MKGKKATYRIEEDKEVKIRIYRKVDRVDKVKVDRGQEQGVNEVKS